MTDVQDRDLGDLVTANPRGRPRPRAHGLRLLLPGRRSLGDACADAGIDA